MKELCLIAAIFSATLQCSGQKHEVHTTIFSTGGHVYRGKTDSLKKSKELDKFHQDVTGLATHNNYLYVSVRRSNWWSTDSSIWRIKITNSTNVAESRKDRKELHRLNQFFKDILCMVIVDGYIYAGRSDGAIWRCSADKQNDCATVYKANYPITGIDYDPKQEKIYAALSSGTLRRCTPNSFKNIYCKRIELPFVYSISTLKVAFDSIWLGVRNKEWLGSEGNDIMGSWLLKCPIWYVHEYSGYDVLSCQFFEKLPHKDAVIKSIGGTNRRLYFSVPNWKDVLYCDPETINSTCYRPRWNPIQIDTFIIVQ